MAVKDKLVSLEVLNETVQAEVVDLKSALNDTGNSLAIPITAKYYWVVKRYINDAGTVKANDSKALSDYIPAGWFHVDCPATDDNNIPLTVVMSEFDASKGWIRNTTVSGDVMAGKDCAFVRFAFGRALDSGVTTTTREVDKYCKIYSLTDSALLDSIADSGNLLNLGYADGYALSSTSYNLSENADYVTTVFLPVSPGEVIYANAGSRYCFYNADLSNNSTGNLSTNGTEIITGVKAITVPANAAYFRIGLTKTSLPTAWIRKASAYDAYLKNLIDNPANTLKMYCIGDSITRGMYTTIGSSSSSGPTEYGYPYWIGQINHYDVVNLGESGGGYANVGTQTNSNGKDIVDNNTFSDADIITIALGVNDYKGTGITLGSMESTAGDGSTIGNMKYMIETLADPTNGKAKKAQIIILLPMNENRFSQGTLATNWAFGYAFHEDKTLADYRDAIRECAEYYNVKVVDLEEVCPINRLNIGNVLGDGLHPTIAFYKQMGQALAPLIH